MERINSTTLMLILTITMLSAVLLVGNRFDAKWAGGEGYEAHATAIVNDNLYSRGEIISSGDEWLEVNFDNTKILMYKDSEIKLVDGRPNKLEVSLIQGRIVVIGNLTVSTRDVRTVVDGTASIVHYSWLDQIEIVSIDGSLKLYRDDRIEDFSGKALQTATLSPYTDEEIDFDASTSSASDFYDWAL
ncbi:MAG: hypothetical protein Q8P30_01830 [Candidatus Uhrbacteria bacterium]|nr:hypothetical protein [Candidatus Uhrbacteria bacterium]